VVVAVAIVVVVVVVGENANWKQVDDVKMSSFGPVRSHLFFSFFLKILILMDIGGY
jgi:hypothetical protein